MLVMRSWSTKTNGLYFRSISLFNPIRHGGGWAILAQIVINVKCFLFHVKKIQLKLLDFLIWYIELSFDEDKIKFFFVGAPLRPLWKCEVGQKKKCFFKFEKQCWILLHILIVLYISWCFQQTRAQKVQNWPRYASFKNFFQNWPTVGVLIIRTLIGHIHIAKILLYCHIEDTRKWSRQDPR